MKKKLGIILIIIGLVAVYAAVKFIPAKEKAPEGPVTVYSNYLYKYSFEFAGTTENLKDGDPANVSVLSSSSSPWIFQVSTQKGGADRPLQALAEAMVKEVTDRAEPVADREVSITDFKVADKPAKYISISRFGDYGNAFVVLINGKNVLTVTGDDSNSENKEAFLAFLKTFNFDVRVPSQVMPAIKK